ncbi:TonB-dependent receptor [Paraburkholderia sp. WC7.3g]|uniref:TonB-dependent receptor n=1 Tax=Paraburkholderia podalyriae TaxID=1938811 RepID=A0ABR7PZR1_9BURK|nr:TonB-dependent receptor [Paraburkholderia podalyriae]MBC8751669.1 TonB-dependent receptor [Paraburkholderia podalyriae]
MPHRHIAGLLVGVMSGATMNLAYAADTATLQGHVLSSADKRPLAGAQVRIRETGTSTTTSPDGTFRFTRLTAGQYTLVITPARSPAVERTVVVRESGTTSDDVLVDAVVPSLDHVTVTSQRTANVVARATQQNAPNMVTIRTAEDIRKTPDVSAAEATARMPGVSLETDSGEGRYVNIRGLDTNLNSTTFDGIHLPPTNPASAQNGGRAVALDTIPAGMIGQIVVTNTNKPEQDADALGGTIDIAPRKMPLSGKPFLDAKLGTGVETLRGTTIQDYELTVGARFGAHGVAGLGSGLTSYSDAPFTFIGTVASNQDHRGVDDVEPAYLDQPGLPNKAYGQIDERHYDYHRNRLGYGGELDFQPNADNKWYFQYYNFGYTESVNRQDIATNFAGNPVQNPDGTITDSLASGNGYAKGLRDEQETLRTQLYALGGENRIGPGKLDYRAGFTSGTYDKPYDYNTAFWNGSPGSVTYYPGYDFPTQTILSGPNPADPSGYTLHSIGNSTQYTKTNEWSANVNYTLPTHFTSAEDEQIKFGAGLRRMSFSSQTNYYSYSPDVGIPLSQAVFGGPNIFYNGMYNVGPSISDGYMRGIYGAAAAAGNVMSLSGQDAASFSAINENIYSAYGQYQFGWGRLGVLAGLRGEWTQATFDGNLIDAATGAVMPNQTANSYFNLFPSLQLRYDFTPTLVGRAIYSSTIARPGFAQSSASVSADPGTGAVTTGNPNLKPTTSQNFDLQIEKYLPHGGIVSLGVFDKSMSDYVVGRVSTVNGSPYLPGYTGPVTLQSFANVSSARVRGLTANYEQHFTQLPGLLGGLGAGANWTWTNSHLDIRPGDDHTLPSAPRNTYNASVFYERGPLDMRLSASYVGASLWAVGGSAATDVYTAARFSLDFGGSYQVRKDVSVYLDVRNILNTPLKFYEGSPDRPIQREFYGPTVMVGVTIHE